MNRFCLWHRRYLCGTFFFFNKDDFAHDTLEDSPKAVPRTGIERVYNAFRDREPGYSSKATISLMQLMGASFTVGFIVGGMKKGNHSYSDFMIANQHAKFITPYEAKRKLQDVVFLNFMKGGVFWGTKAALFTGVFGFCVVAIPLYRDTKEGVLEYVIGGALAATLSRLHAGVKAAFASAAIVGAFASVIGIFAFLSSTSMAEIRDMQYSWYKWRRKRIEADIEASRKKNSPHVFTDILHWREKRLKKNDTLGYSEGEIVYVAIPDPNEVSESTKPEAEDKKSDEQLDPPVTAVVHETTSTN